MPIAISNNRERISNSETTKNQEVFSDTWDTKIIFQRHGAYRGGFPAGGWLHPSDDEKETLALNKIRAHSGIR